jgi:hypothetical protein
MPRPVPHPQQSCTLDNSGRRSDASRILELHVSGSRIGLADGPGIPCILPLQSSMLCNARGLGCGLRLPESIMISAESDQPMFKSIYSSDGAADWPDSRNCGRRYTPSALTLDINFTRNVSGLRPINITNSQPQSSCIHGTDYTIPRGVKYLLYPDTREQSLGILQGCTA